MSIGQRLEDNELSDVSLYQLYTSLGEKDTPRLYGWPYTVDTKHDVPFGGGNSIDRKTKYIDRLLFQEVMDNGLAAAGVTPQQIIDLWLLHEHTEKCILDGDNPVDTYYGGHRRALRREHDHLIVIVGGDKREAKIKQYEAAIWPALERCYNRPVQRPPLDLWCGPLLDDPEDRDEEILKAMAALGVADAKKRSKYSTHYGISGRECSTCKHWSPQVVSQEQGEIAACRIVAGLIRRDRHCDFFLPNEDRTRADRGD
jgi:hypothetical protein